jgi:hypothetical protein
MEYDDFICEQLAKIGNTKQVKEQGEPNVLYHGELNTGLVKRTLIALNLLRDEYELPKDIPK